MKLIRSSCDTPKAAMSTEFRAPVVKKRECEKSKIIFHTPFYFHLKAN